MQQTAISCYLGKLLRTARYLVHICVVDYLTEELYFLLPVDTPPSLGLDAVMTTLLKITLAMLLPVCCATAVQAALPSSIPTSIPVCDDQDSWPPYLQYQVVKGQRTGKLEGYSLDLARLILDKKSIQFEVEMLPWKRCLQNVELGHSAMLLNAMGTPERAKLYLATKPFYSLTAVYIYLSAGPTPRITQASDLGNYRVCGMFGYDYQPFGLGKDQIDQVAHSFEQLVEKLNRKRCDILIGHYEIMAQRSKEAGTSIFQNPQFSFAKIPQLPLVPFVMLISRKAPYAQELRTLMDDGFSEILNGPEDKILKKKWGIAWENLRK